MSGCGVCLSRSIRPARSASSRSCALYAMSSAMAAHCASIGLAHRKVAKVADFAGVLDAALAEPGPVLIEVDMIAIGPFAESFAGPPAGAAGKVA